MVSEHDYPTPPDAPRQSETARTLPESLEYSQIVAMDKANARGRELPAFDGLSVYSYEQVQSILAWIGKHVEPTEHVQWFITSDRLAGRCSAQLKGKCPHVKNLAMKTAMRLCGYEPACAAVEVWHFNFRYKKDGKK